MSVLNPPTAANPAMKSRCHAVGQFRRFADRHCYALLFFRMQRNFIMLVGLVMLLCASLVGAGEAETGSTEKVYRDYTEAYQKAAQSYENAAKQSQSSSYITWLALGIFFVFFATFAVKARRSQKAYMDRALEITLANQKVLEEIRDLLKNGRT